MTYEDAEKSIIEHEGHARMDERDPSWDDEREQEARWEVVLYDKTIRSVGKFGYGKTLPAAVKDALSHLPVKPLPNDPKG
jgi:hypothetical protein